MDLSGFNKAENRRSRIILNQRQDDRRTASHSDKSPCQRNALEPATSDHTTEDWESTALDNNYLLRKAWKQLPL
eukprot:7628712-Heterocapsa_arctica.AAC.1